MTPEERQRLRELAAQATPGPWRLWGLTVMALKPEYADDPGDYDHYQRIAYVADPQWPPTAWNARYVAAVDPQTVLGLLDAYEAAVEQLLNMARACSHMTYWVLALTQRARRAEAANAALREGVEWVHQHATGPWESDPDAWMEAIRERCEQVLTELGMAISVPEHDVSPEALARLQEEWAGLSTGPGPSGAGEVAG